MTRNRTAKVVAEIRGLNYHKGDIEETSKARTILKYAHESAAGLLESFAAVRAQRGASRGTTTDKEQDLLRACLIFAAAGLDSTLKQLIRDALPSLIRRSPEVKDGLEEFVRRQIRGEEDAGEAAIGRKFLAKILTADNQLDELIEQYILNLTGSSLQSAAELAKAANALGVKPGDVGVDPRSLKPIFGDRNKMIHELDIKLSAPTRNRESRARERIIENANVLLEIGERIIGAVEDNLAERHGRREGT